ncbi:MAG: hypothetical protein ABIZ56_06760, partial [Chthoniobacteraceae bacterium]
TVSRAGELLLSGIRGLWWQVGWPHFQSRSKLTVNDPDSPLPSDADSDYELEVETGWWQRSRLWLRTGKGIATVVALLLLAVLCWNAKAIYRGAKLWRASSLIARSEEAGRLKNYAEQFKLLREAFVIAPSTPLTMRAAARYHESRGEAAALPLYESLLATKEATTEDKLRACRLGFTFGKVEFSKKLLDELLAKEESRNKPGVIALEAQLAAAEGKWTQALTLARKAAVAPEAKGEEKLVLAALLTRAGAASAGERAKLRAEAIDVLVSLMDSPEDSGAQAIGGLLSLAREQGAAQMLAGRDVATWVEAAARHPSVPPRVRVAAWDLMLVSRPAEADQTLAAFLAKWRESPLPDRLEAARWLNQHSKPAMSLQLSEPQQEISADWFLVYLDSLAATGRWDSVLEKLKAPTGSAAAMPAALRAVFIMRARMELGEKIDKSEAWRDIQILVPSETVANQLYIAQYAEKTGEARQATTIFRRLLDESRAGSTFKQELSKEEKLACYSGVIRLTPETAPAAELLPLFDGLVVEFPEMAEAANDASYLRLLTGEKSDLLRDRSRELLAKNPAVLAYRTTAALYELRADNAAAAAKLYEGWQIDWATAPDRFKVIRVAVLDATGKKEEAQTLRDTIDAKRLRPEEAKLLEASSG